MYDQLFGFKASNDACTGLVPEKKSGIVYATYLAAVALAMIGWLWLIVWSTLQLI